MFFYILSKEFFLFAATAYKIVTDVWCHLCCLRSDNRWASFGIDQRAGRYGRVWRNI